MEILNAIYRGIGIVINTLGKVYKGIWNLIETADTSTVIKTIAVIGLFFVSLIYKIGGKKR